VSIASAKPGDVFALNTRRHSQLSHWEKVTIARVTKTQAIDTKGRRWLLRTGENVGGSEWDKVWLREWGPQHDQALKDQVMRRRYAKAMEALGAPACNWSARVADDLMRARLPHLEAALT
jgi:hypothetical protein